MYDYQDHVEYMANRLSYLCFLAGVSWDDYVTTAEQNALDGYRLIRDGIKANAGGMQATKARYELRSLLYASEMVKKIKEKYNVN